jgi:cytoskeletal protein RodZ
VFTVSYIRQYADAIGYDAELILEHWRKTAAGVEEPAVEVRRPQTPRWIRFFQSV